MEHLTIGNIVLKNRFILAPMLEVTNLPFRILCREQGAALAFTEMIYVDAILHENKKTKGMMKTCKADKPIGIQITGNNVEEFKKAIPFLRKYDIVDLNCGCPSIKISGNKSGAYLLNNPEKIAQIIKILKDEGLTVTAKIRLGFNKNNVIETAKAIEKAGADAITVHARLAIHSNKIPADWSWIKKVKDAVKIPVIGNGDISAPEQVRKMLNFADGIMIGRAAIGDPAIFSRIFDEKKFNLKENINLFQRYLKLSKKYNLVEMQNIKYVGTHFLRGIDNAGELRDKLMKTKSFEEVEKFMENLLKKI